MPLASAIPNLEGDSFEWGDEPLEELTISELEEAQYLAKDLDTKAQGLKGVEDHCLKDKTGGSELQELDSSEEEYLIESEDGYVSDPSSTVDEAMEEPVDTVIYDDDDEDEDDPMDWYEIAQLEAISDGNFETASQLYNPDVNLLKDYVARLEARLAEAESRLASAAKVEITSEDPPKEA